MNIDLENLSLNELRDLQKQVGRQIETFQSRQKEKAMAAAQQAAEEHGFSLKDLLGNSKSKKSAVAAKYANREDRSITWTGRGRQPQWVKSHLDAGGSLDDLLIK